jgi:hypothetical protein
MKATKPKQGPLFRSRRFPMVRFHHPSPAGVDCSCCCGLYLSVALLILSVEATLIMFSSAHCIICVCCGGSITLIDVISSIIASSVLVRPQTIPDPPATTSGPWLAKRPSKENGTHPRQLTSIRLLFSRKIPHEYLFGTSVAHSSTRLIVVY